MLPRGKSIFIRRLGAFGHTPHEIAERYRAGGFEWACPETLVHDNGTDTPKHHDALSLETFAEMRARGVALFPLWILTALNWRRHLEPFLDHAVSIGAIGAGIDPEVAFRGHRFEALALARAFRAGCAARGLLAYVTTYGHPASIGGFPIEAFAVVDFAIAQTYDAENAFSHQAFVTAQRQYEHAGFSRVYLGAGLYSKKEDRAKTPEEVKRHVSLVPPCPGVVVWPTASISAAVWNVLTSWVAPAAAP